MQLFDENSYLLLIVDAKNAWNCSDWMAFFVKTEHKDVSIPKTIPVLNAFTSYLVITINL